MPDADVKIDWSVDWDETVGLWRSLSGGHTAPVAALPCVHSGPNAAAGYWPRRNRRIGAGVGAGDPHRPAAHAGG